MPPVRYPVVPSNEVIARLRATPGVVEAVGDLPEESGQPDRPALTRIQLGYITTPELLPAVSAFDVGTRALSSERVGYAKSGRVQVTVAAGTLMECEGIADAIEEALAEEWAARGGETVSAAVVLRTHVPGAEVQTLALLLEVDAG